MPWYNYSYRHVTSPYSISPSGYDWTLSGSCLLGPRQAGKTTLARALADELADKAAYLDLELPRTAPRLLIPSSTYRRTKTG